MNFLSRNYVSKLPCLLVAVVRRIGVVRGRLFLALLYSWVLVFFPVDALSITFSKLFFFFNREGLATGVIVRTLNLGKVVNSFEKSNKNYRAISLR